MTSYGERGRIREEPVGDAIRITIGPRQLNTEAGALISCLAAAGFFYILIQVVHKPPRDHAGALVVVLWLAGVLSFSLLTAVGALWEARGATTIEINAQNVIITWSCFSWRRSRAFARSGISNLRVVERRGKGTLVFRNIQFDCGGKRVRATPLLSPSEAAGLMRGPFAGFVQGAG